MDVAARADLQFADNGEAFEGQARGERWWQRQVFAAEQGLRAVGLGQRVDAQDLQGGVVVAAGGARLLDQLRSGGVEVVGMLRQRLIDPVCRELAVGAVGGQQVHLAGRGFPAAVVDVDVGGGAERARQVAFAGRERDPVILAQLFQRLRVEPEDARIADMEEVQLAPLEDQRAEGADVAPVLVETAVAGLGLAVQPGVGRGEDAVGRAAHGPRFGSRKIVVEKGPHRHRAGLLADPAAADAVGQRQGNALAGQQPAARHESAVEILVLRMRTGQRVLADADLQAGGAHRRHSAQATLRFGAVL